MIHYQFEVRAEQWEHEDSKWSVDFMHASREIQPAKIEAYVAHARQNHEAAVDKAVLNKDVKPEEADRYKALFSAAKARRQYVIAVFQDLMIEAVAQWPAGETEAEAQQRKIDKAMLGGAS